MSNEEIKIKDTVMDKIRHDEIKMHSSLYFIAGTILAFVGLVASVVISIFLVSLMQFSLRSHGPMGQYRLEQMLASFPWWAPIVAIGGLVVGGFLLRRYEFAYKKNKMLVMTVFILGVIFAGIIINAMGLDNIWLKRDPMRGLMRRNMQMQNVDWSDLK